MQQQTFGNAAALLALGAALNPAAQHVVDVVAEATSSKEAEAEAIYRDWLEIANERIVAEQILLGTASAEPYTLLDGQQNSPGESDLFVVLTFFDQMSSKLFTRQVDVGELSNYLASDALRWRELLRALRARSVKAEDAARYHQLTRALAAIEFLSSEPISDAARREFELLNIRAEPDEHSRTITIRADVKSNTQEARNTPNVAVCLRDSRGNVCGEAVVRAPTPQMRGQQTEPFVTSLTATSDISDVEVSFTRRGCTDGP